MTHNSQMVDHGFNTQGTHILMRGTLRQRKVSPDKDGDDNDVYSVTLNQYVNVTFHCTSLNHNDLLITYVSHRFICTVLHH